MSKTKLFSVTPVKDEADRYLASMLGQVAAVVDEVFVYDDQSTDDSSDIYSQLTQFWRVREDGVPSFLEHEGRYRQDVWDCFQEVCQPSPGDWVLAIDADELLVSTGTNCCLRCEVEQVIKQADAQGAKSVRLPIPEVFGIDADGVPLVRKDGLWGTIAGTRLFRYERGGKFRDRPMGCDSEPTYVSAGIFSRQALGLRLMHFGYANKDDQIAKHRRYTSLAAHGHLDAHVQSIISPPTLVRVESPVLVRRSQ